MNLSPPLFCLVVWYHALGTQIVMTVQGSYSKRELNKQSAFVHLFINHLFSFLNLYCLFFLKKYLYAKIFPSSVFPLYIQIFAVSNYSPFIHIQKWAYCIHPITLYFKWTCFLSSLCEIKYFVSSEHSQAQSLMEGAITGTL